MKKVTLILGICMLLLFLSGCGYTIEEKRLMKEYEKTGKENAISYIEGKYGFTPVVDGVECFTMGIEFKIDFTPPPTGDVFVKMKNEEKNLEFWVYTTGEESNQEKCWDNYQHKEIDEAIENQLKTLLGVDIKHLEIAYGMFNSEGISVDGNISMYKKYGLVHDYFDGDNLAEVLNHTEGNKILACIIAEKHIPDLMDCSIGEFIERGIYEGDVAEGEKLIQVIGENTNCMIVNYKDQESCNLAHQQKEISHDIHHSDFKGCVDDLYFFMKDHYYLIGKHRSKKLHYEYAKYEVKQYDNLYYIQMGGTYCNFTKVENEMDSASTWNGRGFLQAKKVYGEYAVDSDADKLYIYIPSSTIEGIERLETMVDRSNISLAVQKYFEKEEEQWEIMYDTEHFSIIEEFSPSNKEKYLITTLYLGEHYKDTVFSIFIDEEK